MDLSGDRHFMCWLLEFMWWIKELMCWLGGFKWRPPFYVLVIRVYVVDERAYVLVEWIYVEAAILCVG